jgi:hypothetical protein
MNKIHSLKAHIIHILKRFSLGRTRCFRLVGMYEEKFDGVHFLCGQRLLYC